MAVIKQSVQVPYSCAQMYQLIADIEKYPEFLPWCNKVVIQQNLVTKVIASIYISKGPLNISFTTENTLQENKQINMQHVTGPFKHLQGGWYLSTIDDNSCRIDFSLDYVFANKLLSIAVEPIFGQLCDKLVDSFIQRANHIYG